MGKASEGKRDPSRVGTVEVEILAWLAERECGTASEIATGCGLAIVSARGRLAILNRAGLVSGEVFGDASAAKAYAITELGRRETTS